MKFNNKGVQVSKNASIGTNVSIGDNTVIYDNVHIGDNTVISNNCIIGEPTKEYYNLNGEYLNQPTYIGCNSLIRSHNILYSGSSFGEQFITGHKTIIRENTKIGDFCRIGTLCDIQGDVQIGNYCFFHSNVHIGQKSRIANFVFIYPYVVLTNDPTPPSENLKGVIIDDFAQIAVHSVILPGIHISKHTLVGANTTLTKDTDPFDLVIGNPGVRIKDVRDLEINGKKHYPWPYNFNRNMPWEKIGYEKWLKLTSD
jgi:acetyltransferase-like isoleucine patch superfamily enzyme